MRSRLRAGARALRARIAEVRYMLGDGLYAVSRVPRWIWRQARGLWTAAGRALRRAWRRLRRLWDGLDVYIRRRLTAVAMTLAAAALIWFALVPVAPCQLPGGDECPPGDDAEELVPAAALAYLHVNLEPGTEQADRAAALAAELPTLSAELRRLVAPIPGLGLDLGDWFGGEVATALLPGGSSGAPRTVVLFEAENERGALDFARELLGEDREEDRHRGVAIESGGGQAGAVAGGFLIAGEESAVRRVIDTEAGEAPALAGDDSARAVRDRLPDARLGEAYASGVGARRLLRPGGGPLALFEPFVNPTAATAAAAAVELTEDGIELSVVSDQDPDLAEQSPGFFGAFEPFEPELPERLAQGTFAYLGLGRPAEGARELISSAAADAPALAAAIEGLARSLQRQGQISLVDQVLPLLGDEASISIGPRGRPSGGAVPYLALLSRGIDEGQASKDLARLQGPIARAVGVRGGGSFGPSEVAGASAETLRVSPALELTYSVFDELLVFATQPDAVAAARGGDSLGASDPFREATSDLGGTPLALLFADLPGLVELGERAGLAEDPAYAIFASDLRRLGGIGLLVSRDGRALSTELRLLVD